MTAINDEHRLLLKYTEMVQFDFNSNNQYDNEELYIVLQ